MVEALTAKDKFAELLSRGLEVPIIAERMGMNARSANAMMTRIRKDLGPQARG